MKKFFMIFIEKFCKFEKGYYLDFFLKNLFISLVKKVYFLLNIIESTRL